MSCHLVVNADDLGVTKGATLGIVRAHREGIVTSASLAVTTDAYQHAIEECVRVCPNLGIGLHFTLTHGKPVSPVDQVPLLVDDRGFFKWRFTSLYRLRGKKRAALLAQIEIELEAQLQRLAADGIKPDHINGERHVHLIPGIFELVAAAARRHNVPFLRLGADVGTACLQARHVPGLIKGGGFAKMALLSSLSARHRPKLPHGVRSTDSLASYLYTGRLDQMLEFLMAELPIPPSGTIEVMVHPGVPEESQGAVLGNAESERYMTDDARRRELEICIAAREWTDGWALTTFRQLADAQAGRVIERMRTAHVPAVARLHVANLTGLLTQLGERGARAYYTGCMKSRTAMGFVAVEDGSVSGFALGSTHPQRLKKRAYHHNRMATINAIALAVLKRPWVLRWLLKSFGGPDDGRYDARAAELTYLAVDPVCRGTGTSQALVNEFTRAMRPQGARRYELSVDENNARAIKFYEKLGFTQVGRYREFGVQHRRYRLDVP